MFDDQHRWVISGGIGSGKSAVRRLLAEYGFSTLDADSIGHDVLRSDGPAFDEVASRWPQVVDEGEIDRSALGRIVFADVGELRNLEEITHPHIFGRIQTRVQEISGPVFVEIPAIEHSLGGLWCSLIVDCHDDQRMCRMVARGMDLQDVQSRMRMQPSREQWLARADLVVANHGSLEDLHAAVARVAKLF